MVVLGGGALFLMSEVPLYCLLCQGSAVEREREFFYDNLLVRIHLIIEMILVDRPCATPQYEYGTFVTVKPRLWPWLSLDL